MSSATPPVDINLSCQVEDFRKYQSKIQHPMVSFGVDEESPGEPVPVFDQVVEELRENLSELETSIEDLMRWKDNFTQQSVPSSVKLEITILFSKLFRSKSDLHSPLFEIIRLVKIYARQWNVNRLQMLELERDYQKYCCFDADIILYWMLPSRS
jgi:hypothetical protein